ncbi:MAG: hypothetical protein H6679_03165 [Epsilonproteobacteria bacterium]|nr:hypothetical protein [Campylobacterota bacterium]
MKRRVQAFMIIELLLAITLSSFVILGAVQAYFNMMNYLSRSRRVLDVSRKVGMLFNQLEKDVSTAYIPQLHDDVLLDKGAKGQPQDGQEKKAEQLMPDNLGLDFSKEDKKKEREEKLKSYFIGLTDERGLPIKVSRKELAPFKSMNFICTNPLQMMGQKKKRLVRIMYELVLDKQRSTRENKVYTLWRKETEELGNVEFKVDEFSKKKHEPVRSYIVADGVKAMSVVYVKEKELDEKEKKEKLEKKKEYERALVWGDKPERQGITPEWLELYVVFWDETLQESEMYHVLLPIISYHLVAVVDNKKQTIDQQLNQAGVTALQQASPVPEQSPQLPPAGPNTPVPPPIA